MVNLAGVLGCHSIGQSECFNYDFALYVWAGYFQILADVEPDRFYFLRYQLDHVLEPEYVVCVLQGKCLCNISQFDILDISIFLWQDEYVAVWVLHVVIVLHEVFADHGHFARSRCLSH